MADMYDCGVYTFEAWARQTPSPAYGYCFFNRWLGDFNPDMPAEEAARRYKSKRSEHGQEQFMRGWRHAQNKYREQCDGRGNRE